MVKKIAFIILGLLIGIAFDVLPHAFEVVAKTRVCRESCSSLLKVVSVVIYAILPITWGGLLGIVAGKPHATRILCTSALFSLLIMAVLTWVLYRQQHP
jgi:predicted lysophospholipase L1 biosynthesis ABC-type transport system permease subunit